MNQVQEYEVLEAGFYLVAYHQVGRIIRLNARQAREWVRDGSLRLKTVADPVPTEPTEAD